MRRFAAPLLLFPMLASLWAFADPVTRAHLRDVAGEAARACVEAVESVQCTETTVHRPVETRVRTEIERLLADVEGTVGAGLTGDDGDGCDRPGYHLTVSARAGGTLSAHAHVEGGANLACRASTSADIGFELEAGRLSLDLGYDRRAVSVQEVDAEAGRVVFYGAAVAETAALSLDLESGGVEVELGATLLPRPAPRVAASADLAGWRLDADAVRHPSTGVVSTFRAARAFEVADGWAVELFAAIATGLRNVPDPIAWRNDAGLQRGPGAPPNTGTSFGIAAVRQL